MEVESETTTIDSTECMELPCIEPSLPQAAKDSTHISADSTSNTDLLQVNDSENLYLEQEPYDHEEPSCST